MIIFPYVAYDTGCKILYSLDPIQFLFRSFAPNMKYSLLKTKALIMLVKVFLSKACLTRLICPSCAMQLDTVEPMCYMSVWDPGQLPGP